MSVTLWHLLPQKLVCLTLEPTQASKKKYQDQAAVAKEKYKKEVRFRSSAPSVCAACES